MDPDNYVNCVWWACQVGDFDSVCNDENRPKSHPRPGEQFARCTGGLGA